MAEPAINIEKLNYIYSPATAFAHQALTDINLQFMAQQIIAVVGQTGSGKSTLMQLVDGLLKPTTGSITVQNVTVNADSKKEVFVDLRRHVGFVFQFPESQLFADTVIEDVMFGPRNLGMTDDEAHKAAIQALNRLHFPDQLLQRSPFELSGGQMRRVAIAGVLAMDPEILILDEPTAGLDPSGRRELMELIKQLNTAGTTIILITHQMEQVVEFADQVVALKQGKVAFQGTPRALFKNDQLVHSIGLSVPATIRFAQELRGQGVDVDHPLTMNELAQQIINVQQKGIVDHGE